MGEGAERQARMQVAFWVGSKDNEKWLADEKQLLPVWVTEERGGQGM